MKKTRFLVLALTVAVMMMGAGYAWWSETVVIDTDVTTGYLDVDLTAVSPNTSSSEGVGVVVTPTSSVDGNDNGEYCNIRVTNLYPGGFGEGKVAVTNTGTMKVKLGKPILASQDNWDWYDYVDIRYNPTLVDNGASVALTKNIYGDYTFAGDVYLNVGETCYFSIKASMPTTVDDDEQQDDLSFTFKPTFIQWNQQ